jgi:hypothetical protein
VSRASRIGQKSQVVHAVRPTSSAASWLGDTARIFQPGECPEHAGTWAASHAGTTRSLSRPTGMNKALCLVVAGPLALAGCDATTSSDTGSDDGTIQVTTTYRAGPSGELYIEGAMVDIELRDAAGEVIGHESAAPGEPITFSDLPTGIYVIAPALRPCDGNCGYLDARTDGCHNPIHVAGDLRIHVSFRVSAPCTMETSKA